MRVTKAVTKAFFYCSSNPFCCSEYGSFGFVVRPSWSRSCSAEQDTVIATCLCPYGFWLTRAWLKLWRKVPFRKHPTYVRKARNGYQLQRGVPKDVQPVLGKRIWVEGARSTYFFAKKALSIICSQDRSTDYWVSQWGSTDWILIRLNESRPLKTELSERSVLNRPRLKCVSLELWKKKGLLGAAQCHDLNQYWRFKLLQWCCKFWESWRASSGCTATTWRNMIWTKLSLLLCLVITQPYF